MPAPFHPSPPPDSCLPASYILEALSPDSTGAWAQTWGPSFRIGHLQREQLTFLLNHVPLNAHRHKEPSWSSILTTLERLVLQAQGGNVCF